MSGVTALHNDIKMKSVLRTRTMMAEEICQYEICSWRWLRNNFDGIDASVVAGSIVPPKFVVKPFWAGVDGYARE